MKGIKLTINKTGSVSGVVFSNGFWRVLNDVILVSSLIVYE